MDNTDWPYDKITERRMHFARIIDKKNPQACWADLVMWAMGLTNKKDVSLDECLDSERPCYCGKFQVGE